MEFPLISSLADTIKSRVEALTDNSGERLFKDVRVCCISGYRNLFKVLPDLSLFPACIIAVGGAEYPDNFATRELEVAILIVDEFRVVSDQAASSYALLETVSQAFTSEVPGQRLQIENFNIKLIDIRPLDLDSELAAWHASLNVTTGFVM